MFDTHALDIQQRRHTDKENFLAEHCAANLLERLSIVKQSFDKVLLFGKAPELFAQRFQSIDTTVAKGTCYDLIISNLQLHRINDVPGYLVQIRHLLQPNGLFIGSFLGGKTLQELRQSFIEAESAYNGKVHPRVFPFIDLTTASSLLTKSGFTQPIADREQLNVSYQTPSHLMQELRAMNETNILSTRTKTFTPRGIFNGMSKVYQQKFATENQRIKATFEVMYLTGWTN